MNWAYYNEHDPFAAAWLRELIRDNLIAPGEVDERSIEDVTPDELRSFRQCHFFAGVGVWSLAARQAGIPDDAPLWSGSCPCQPFSAAGKGGGFDDERHLWPAFHYLIEQCGPALVAGEQVTGADGDAWFDLVSADLDATAYAFGVAETVAAGFGAPHKRSRNYWLAYAHAWLAEQLARRGAGPGQASSRRTYGQPTGRGDTLGVADHDGDRQRAPGNARRGEPEHHAQSGGAIVRLGVANDQRHERAGKARGRGLGLPDDGATRGLDDVKRDGRGSGRDDHGGHVGNQLDATHEQRPRRIDRPGPVNGYWRDADWLRCRDEKWRPVESGSFPLVDAGTFRNRVGLLRGAGNAITIGQAEGFLRAVVASVGPWW